VAAEAALVVSGKTVESAATAKIKSNLGAQAPRNNDACYGPVPTW